VRDNGILSLHYSIYRLVCPCGSRGCKHRALSISWPEVVKGVPNQDADFSVSYDSFFSVFLLSLGVCAF